MGKERLRNNSEHFWHPLLSVWLLFVIRWPVGLSIALRVRIRAGRYDTKSLRLFCWTIRTISGALLRNVHVLRSIQQHGTVARYRITQSLNFATLMEWTRHVWQLLLIFWSVERCIWIWQALFSVSCQRQASDKAQFARRSPIILWVSNSRLIRFIQGLTFSFLSLSCSTYGKPCLQWNLKEHFSLSDWFALTEILSDEKYKWETTRIYIKAKLSL